MTAQATPGAEFTPGDHFEIRGIAYTIADARWFKNDGALHIRAEVEVGPGQFKYADIRLLDTTANWWNSHEADVDKVKNPKPKPAPKAEKQADAPAQPATSGDKPSLVPTDPSQMTVDQLKGFADARGIAYPQGGKKAEILAAVKDGLREQRESQAA